MTARLCSRCLDKYEQQLDICPYCNEHNWPDPDTVGKIPSIRLRLPILAWRDDRARNWFRNMAFYLEGPIPPEERHLVVELADRVGLKGFLAMDTEELEDFFGVDMPKWDYWERGIGAQDDWDLDDDD
jgi:hypothetical protein